MIGPKLILAQLERWAMAMLVLGVIALGLLLVVARIEPDGACRAFLLAWLFWLGIPAGSMVLLAIGPLTGGRWLAESRPALSLAAGAMPVLAVLFVPVVLCMARLYPWAADPGAAAAPDVARLYLNPTAFIVRGVVILVFWSAFAVVLVRNGPLTPLWAGIGLALYAITVSFAAVDWSMSLAPKWHSTAYGALFALMQVTSALAFLALLRSGEPRHSASSDVAELLLAAVLGITYLGFMQFLVIWASGLPDKTSWYELRAAGAFVIIAAFAVGGVAPFLLLIERRVRQSARGTGLAGLLVLVGIALQWVWQVWPSGTGDGIWFALLALIGIGGLWTGLALGPLAAALHRAGAVRDA